MADTAEEDGAPVNSPVIGPLINPVALARVARDVDDAVAAGARILVGGAGDGPCYRPTILADVPSGRTPWPTSPSCSVTTREGTGGHPI